MVLKWKIIVEWIYWGRWLIIVKTFGEALSGFSAARNEKKDKNGNADDPAEHNTNNHADFFVTLMQLLIDRNALGKSLIGELVVWGIIAAFLGALVLIMV